MGFFSRQISSEKWGIYSETGLLATVSCQSACDTILANLQNGRRDVPTGEINSLYQVPKLQNRPAPAPVTGRRSHRPPVSTRKTRKLKIDTTVPSTIKPVNVSKPAKVSVSKSAKVSNPAKVSSVDSSNQVHSQKVSDLSGLQAQQIRMAQATGGVSSQSPQLDSAERA